MKNYTSSKQLSISFDTPFEKDLAPTNRWVIMSKLVDWDSFANVYYQNFKSTEGRTPVNARVVLGAVIIKHYFCLSDIETIEMIKENPYLQYFIGYKAFSNKPAFDPSLFVSIRKRMGDATFDSLTNSILNKIASKKQKKASSSQSTPPSSDNNSQDNNGDNLSGTTTTESMTPELPNKGKLQIDATVADAYIKYPTDLDLLNDARQKSEVLIDYLRKLLPNEPRPRTYKRVARKAYLNTAKKRNKSKKEIRSAIRFQINCLKRNIKSINKLLDKFKTIPFNRDQYKYFLVIQELLRQQDEMYTNSTHICEHRIVSIHQPHVRPIVRGKAKHKVEFGNKINVTLDNGIAQVHRFSWDAYNEGADLQEAIEAYHKRHGRYPELIQADKIYLTKANRAYLKEKGIRHSDVPLGRKPKQENISRYQKAKRKREAAERNHIEAKFGQAKARYALNKVKARLACTSLAWINSILLVMNLVKIHCAYFLVRLFCCITLEKYRINIQCLNYCNLSIAIFGEKLKFAS